MAEDIIITPASGKIDFYDSASTVTTWVIETGTLKFKRGATTYLSMVSSILGRTPSPELPESITSAR